MENAVAPATRKATNLWLREDIKDAARKIARARYGMSLSELTERLFIDEIKRKRGIAHLPGNQP